VILTPRLITLIRIQTYTRKGFRSTFAASFYVLRFANNAANVERNPLRVYVCIIKDLLLGLGSLCFLLILVQRYLCNGGRFALRVSLRVP